MYLSIMGRYSIEKIAEIVSNDTSIIYPEEDITDLFFDSRMVKSPSGVLFFAIKTDKNDGHNYINTLIDFGVRNFIISHDVSPELYQRANFIKVSDSVNALHQIAAFHRDNKDSEFIAITGSNGKTVVKEWMYQILSSKIQTYRSPKSYNSQLGVPLSLWDIDKNPEICIIEAGISKPDEMDKLAEMIKPDIGILTNIGSAHQKNFKSLRHKLREKLELFDTAKYLVFSVDNKIIRDEVFNFVESRSVKLFTWSYNDNMADVFVEKVNRASKTSEIVYNYGDVKECFTIPFTDSASIENCLNILSTILLLGYKASDFNKQFESLQHVAMRLDLRKAINNCLLINDYYNSDITSLTIALDFLSQQNRDNRHTVVLSDIEQSNLTGKELYTRVNKLLERYSVKRLIGIGKNINENRDLFKISSDFYESTDDFLKDFHSRIFSNEVILLKGARSFEFEKISTRIEEKTHQTRLEVNLDAIRCNLDYFRAGLKPGVKIMAMVKAFSYGSGSFELANILQYHNVDYLSVAFADEGIELRSAGISLPIMVMSPETSAFEAMVDNDLEPEIYSISVLKEFITIAKKHGLSEYPVHIKLDTGMHRLGFVEDDIDELIVTLKTTDTIKVKSAFTHLAGSDSDSLDYFTNQQVDVYNSYIKRIEEEIGYSFIKHVLNSNGIIRFPKYHFDMVRLGIGLYGGIEDATDKLKTVSSLKSFISQIKFVCSGDTVGYSRMGKLKRDSRIATIPIGYADGIRRSYGNGNGDIFINGKRAPIIGNICMDMCMVDITDIEAAEGDVVEIFGENISIFEIAEKTDTIPYEVLTSVSSRVKRVYYRE